MTEILIHADKIAAPAMMPKLCPFGAIEIKDGTLSVSSACRMCRLCVKKGPEGAFELVETRYDEEVVDINQWKGVAVYVEHEAGEMHPVSLELLGKARELARTCMQPVNGLVIGSDVRRHAERLLTYGADEVFVYEHPAFEHFRIEPFAAAFSDFVATRKPAIMLVGGTTVGRSLAPRVAARFRTGLTADCTSLEIQDDGALAQIRPAFGGNIMAHIVTPKRRPQFATVRYKVFSSPEKLAEPKGRVTFCGVKEEFLESAIKVVSVSPKRVEKGIEEAEVIITAGRGVKKREDLEMLQELATLLNGELAATRPLIEAGWVDPRRQIGLSGRTVKPKLLIACGISGSVQFAAGMKGGELIMAVNSDKDAPIFKIAHRCIVGDLYEILPELIAVIKAVGVKV